MCHSFYSSILFHNGTFSSKITINKEISINLVWLNNTPVVHILDS